MIDSLAIWDTWKTEPYDPLAQLAAGQSELGTREYGNNCQKFSHLQSGVTCQAGGWCVSFACCILAAGGFPWGRADLKPGRQQFYGRGFASTALLVGWGEELGIAHDPWNYTAKPGDLICVKNWVHTSTCVHDDGGSTLVTIDGNTSNQVAYRQRYRSTVGKIIAVTAFANVGSPTVAQIKAQQPEEDDMQTIALQGAGFPQPSATLVQKNREMQLRHGAHIKWEGTGGNPDAAKETTGADPHIQKIPGSPAEPIISLTITDRGHGPIPHLMEQYDGPWVRFVAHGFTGGQFKGVLHK